MEDGDIVEVHMEQLGGAASDADDEEDWEDWVDIKDDKLAQKIMAEKATLYSVIDKLKKEVSALKINNRAIAKENNNLKVDKKDMKVCIMRLCSHKPY